MIGHLDQSESAHGGSDVHGFREGGPKALGI